MNLVISPFEHASSETDVEIVERKGIGHPDTICDALAERLSVELSRFYLSRFGSILHHNVDKALLRGGISKARFGGGEVIEPIDVYLAGRATTSVGDVSVPVEELSVECARAWLAAHIHALDPVRHVRVHCLVRPGSMDLKDLFARRGAESVPLANDTSFGVGYAPESPLEGLTGRLERELNSPAFIAEHPAHGEDLKIMAVRCDDRVSITMGRAFVAAHVPSFEAYRDEKAFLASFAARAASACWPNPSVFVNAADSEDGSAVYLTVTGTSAESGDDGEVGRGNRANGLITPGRPMSLEALCGKNSVTHVGKLYNVAARAIAESAVRELRVRAAECYLVSRIGARIDEPMLAHVRFDSDRDPKALEKPIDEMIRSHLRELPTLWRRIVDESVPLY